MTPRESVIAVLVRHAEWCFVIDAYLIGVERGIDYQRRFPEDTEVRPPNPLLRCGCWLCKAEDVGRETGRRAVLDGAR